MKLKEKGEAQNNKLDKKRGNKEGKKEVRSRLKKLWD